MKWNFKILILLVPLFLGLKIPKPISYVSDHAGIISEDTEIMVNRLAGFVKKRCGVEMATVTVKNMQGTYIEDFAVELFQSFGIGEKGKDNGILLLIAVEERKMRIEVGYGLEGIIPDGKAGRIRDEYITPYLRKNDFNRGVLYGNLAIAKIIAGNYNFSLDELKAENIPVSRTRPTGSRRFRSLFYLFFLLMIFGGRWFLPLLFLPLLGGTGRFWSGGSFGGGGFGGGFSGFGGGFSGGGGASGSF